MINRKAISILLTAGLLTSTLGTAAYADTSTDTTADTSSATATASASPAPDEVIDPYMQVTPNGENLQTPPAKPDGETGDMQTPPAKPDGETDNMKMAFNDVSEDSWYYDYVLKAYRAGLVSGVSDTEFSPETDVTGAELLTMLYRADGNTTSADYDGSWYDEAVSWATENSIISDDCGWDFDPEANLTREQMMVIIYRFMEYKSISFEDLSDLSQFTDSSSVSDYASGAVKALVGKGYIVGSDGMLRPSDKLTRAEVSKILVAALEGAGMINEKPDGGKPDGGKPSFGGSGEVTQGTSATTISEDGTYSDTEYASTGDDENALRVDGAEVTLDGITVNKSAGASSNTEDGDFYGMNAALLATNGAAVTIKNATVSSSAQNGNGIFSYGDGTTVNVSDTTITTTADNSGGIQTTGGGTMNASNLTVNTSGSSAAAIRSDRGGGTVNVDGGTYVSNGYNSPAIYSTAAIDVKNATLTANNSEALVIEGKNSIDLTDCDVSGNMSDTKGTSSNENVHNVMIYQSMSGDADVGTSEFSMTGGTLTSNNGDVIYVTNTHSVIKLSDVDIINNDSDSYLMRICGNSASRGWGTAGSNGAQAEVTLDNQTVSGDIAVDTISTLDLVLTNGSALTGTINIIENAEGGTAVSSNADVTIESGCTWTLTGDCTVSTLTNNGTINYNGYTITLADGTVLSE